MTEQKHTQPSAPETESSVLQDHLADLNETMEREKIPLSPEMKAYLKQSVEAVQTKLMKGGPIYPKDMEFVEKIKIWILIQPLLPVIPKLKARFEENKYLHEGVEWKKIEESLRENPEALWSVNEMEKAGHEPDVYNADKEGFEIGTCCKESPEQHRGIVYDKEAAEKLRKENPGEKFNGSAVEIAKAMKIELMSEEQYEDILQAKGEFDTETWSWLKTPADIRKSGRALFGVRDDADVGVARFNAGDHSGVMGWRGSLRVLWKKT